MTPDRLSCPGPPLLVSDDPDLLAVVHRGAAAAGVLLDVPDTDRVPPRAWVEAGLVLVGADRAAQVAALGWARRPAVWVLGRPGHRVDDGLLRLALEIGAVGVLDLPAATDRLTALLGEAGEDRSADGLAVAVVGGSGGVGASVLAASLAVVGSWRGPTLLMDLDSAGAGLGRVLGPGGDPADPDQVTGWSELAGSPGRLGARALREALPGLGARSGGPGRAGLSGRAEEPGLRLLGWPAGAARAEPDDLLLREVLAAARRGHDRVVLDLPRGNRALAREAAGRCDRVLLVVRGTLDGVAAAAVMTRHLHGHVPTPEVVVRRERGGGLSGADVAEALGLRLVAEIREERRLTEHLALGVGPVPSTRGRLARTCLEIWAGGPPVATGSDRWAS